MQKTNLERKKIFDKIVRLIIKDPEKGLKVFYNRYGKMIYLTAIAVGCKEDQANSVVNGVLVKVWKKCNDLFSIENPEGWIYVVTKNCAKDEMKGVWCLELNENICQAEDCFEAILSKANYEYLLKHLSEEEQSIISYKMCERYSFQEIGEILEKPLPTVSSTYYRAIEKVRKKYNT